MLRMRMMYVYLLSVGIASSCISYAMDITQKEHRIDRKKLASEVDATLSRMKEKSKVDDVSEEAISILKQRVPVIAQIANMPDRQKIIAQGMIKAKQHSDYNLQEPGFEQRHAACEIKELQQKIPYYMTPIPYDCVIWVKQKDKNGETDIGEYHIMHANQKCSIHDGQKVILAAIRDYTRDYSKRSDGKLNADQPVECTVQFGANHLIYAGRAGDAWQSIEHFMKLHIEKHLEKNQK